MSSWPEQSNTDTEKVLATSTWLRRFLIALTVLAWMVTLWIVYVFAGIIAIPLILLLIAAIIAYVLYPFVKTLSRFIPRALAITLVYLLIFGTLVFAVYFLLSIVIAQVSGLVHTLQTAFADYQKGKYPQLKIFLAAIGVTQESVTSSEQTLLKNLGGVAGNIIPFVGNLFTYFIYMVVTTSVSVYLLVDAPRVTSWLKHDTPVRFRSRINFFLDTINTVAGGYLRGQVLLAIIVAVIVTIGAFVIGVPYAPLIGVIVFILEFIPQIGAYISGPIGILIALSHSWETALIYAVFVTLVQGVLDGQILSPRILGKSVGVNPAISLIMLFIFGTLFGLWGAFLSVPILGVVQAFAVAYWKKWKQSHPEEFSEAREPQESKEDSSSASVV